MVWHGAVVEVPRASGSDRGLLNCTGLAHGPVNPSKA